MDLPNGNRKVGGFRVVACSNSASLFGFKKGVLMRFPWWKRALESFQMTRVTRRRSKLSAAPVEPLEYRLLLTARVWDGGSVTTDQWTNRFNWEGNIRPNSGDDLVFPDSIRFTDRGLNNVFPSGTDFHNITFEGEGYLIRGNRIDVTGDITSAPESDGAIGDSKLNLDFEFSAGNHRIEFLAGAVAVPELEFNGKLTDSGNGIIISGDGQVIFGGNVANNINTHHPPRQSGHRRTCQQLPNPPHSRQAR